VPARPAWNSRYTMAEFFSTALLLGPMFVRALDSHGLAGGEGVWIARAAIFGGAAQLVTQSLKFLSLARSEEFELRASALLLSGRLQRAFLIRLAVLVAAGIALPLVTNSAAVAAIALVLGLAGELLGRWLFFVSVVPKSIASTFALGRAA